MGPALVTAVSAVVVGFLVFLAGRLEARDELRTITRQVELLDKLDKDSPSRAVLEAETYDALTYFSKRQALRRELRSPLRVSYALLTSLVVVFIGAYSVSYFELGKFKNLVVLLILVVSGLAIGLTLGFYGSQFVRWYRKRRAKPQEPPEAGNATVGDDPSLLSRETSDS